MQFPEMADYLYRKGLLSETPPDPMLTSEMFGDMDDDAFNKIIDQLPFGTESANFNYAKSKRNRYFPNSAMFLSSVIPAIHLDRDRAIITLVDSNLQRENILPSERAFAYKMKSSVPRLTYIIILKLIMLPAEAARLSLKKANAPCRKESFVSLRRLPNTILSSMMTPPCSALCYEKARLIQHSFPFSHEKTYFPIFSEPFYRMILMPIISCFFQKIISG